MTRLGRYLQAQEVCFGTTVGHECTETLLPDSVAAGDGIVAVLHSVLGPAGKELADVGPLVAHLDLRVD